MSECIHSHWHLEGDMTVCDFCGHRERKGDCPEGRIGCAYDYGELDDEPCYSCAKGSNFKPKEA